MDLPVGELVIYKVHQILPNQWSHRKLIDVEIISWLTRRREPENTRKHIRKRPQPVELCLNQSELVSSDTVSDWFQTQFQTGLRGFRHGFFANKSGWSIIIPTPPIWGPSGRVSLPKRQPSNYALGSGNVLATSFSHTYIIHWQLFQHRWWNVEDHPEPCEKSWAQPTRVAQDISIRILHKCKWSHPHILQFQNWYIPES